MECRRTGSWTQGRLEAGIHKGKAEGLDEGKREGQCEIARKLKARGTEASEIAEITGLAIEEIEKI